MSDLDRLLAIRRLMANYRAPATGVLPSATAQDRRPQAYREGAGKPTALAEGLSAFMGQQPRYSVMDPQSDEFRRAREIGEQASVAAEFYGALSPFAAASTMASAQRAGSLLSPLTVFHGSPHKFSKFDASKIGTGEGAQAYGHGLYFAESPAVAKGYQSRLAGGTDPYQYQYQGRMYEPGSEKNPVTHALGLIYHQGSKFAQNIAKQGLKDAKAGDAFALDMGGVDYYQRMLDVAKTAKKSDIQATQGAFYKVDLPDEQIAKMLDWDKPLSQQKDIVKNITPESLGLTYTQLPNGNHAFVNQEGKILGNLQKGGTQEGFTKNWMSDVMRGTGQDLYKMLGQGMEKSPAVSGALREAGIPGIRYLDQGSRGKGGTSNFVVFPGEESKLRIMEVNGKPVVINEDEFLQGLLGL